MTQTLTSQWLARAGPDEDARWETNLCWFRAFLLLHVAVRGFLTIHLGHVIEHSGEVYLCWGLVACGFAGVIPPCALWATRFAACLVLAELCVTVPFTANHVFLELVCLGMLGLLNDRDARKAELLLQVMRWMVAIFFFYTGLQKLLYGWYFRGELLTYLAATEERFALLFRYILSGEQLRRLQSFNLEAVGPGRFKPQMNAGPYRVDGVAMIVVSNAVYIFEMLAGVLLTLRRTRAFAALASIVFVVLIEVAARELTFGTLMINLLLLFVPGAWIKWMFPVWVAGYAYLVLASLEVVPMFWYSPA